MIKYKQKNIFSSWLRMYIIVMFSTRMHFEYILCNSLRDKKLLYYRRMIWTFRTVWNQFFPKIDVFAHVCFNCQYLLKYKSYSNNLYMYGEYSSIGVQWCIQIHSTTKITESRKNYFNHRGFIETAWVLQSLLNSKL